jgi:hypothetical protein
MANTTEPKPFTKKQLYIYKTHDGYLRKGNDVYYYPTENKKTIEIKDEAVLKVLEKATFDQPTEKPTCCTDMKICEPVLKATHALGHTHLSVKYKEYATSMKKLIPVFMTQAMMEHQNSLLTIADELISEQEAIRDAVESSENLDENEKIQCLLRTDKLLHELDLLSQKIGSMVGWCDADLLEQHWGKLPNFTKKSDKDSIQPEERKTQLMHNMQFYIKKQKKLLLNGAKELTEDLKVACDINNQTIQNLDQSNKKLMQQIQNLKNKYQNTKNNFDNELQKKQLIITEKELSIDQLLLKIDELTIKEQLLKEFSSPDLLKNCAIVSRLLERTQQYRAHLISKPSTDSLYVQKLQHIDALLEILNNHKNPAQTRLIMFAETIRDAYKDLKPHRNSKLQRFFQDIFRILLVGLSYVTLVPAGIYKCVHGRGPTFFSPSEGKMVPDEFINMAKSKK